MRKQKYYLAIDDYGHSVKFYQSENRPLIDHD